MGGATDTISAPTEQELEQKVKEWYKKAKNSGLEDARHPWNPDDVRKTDQGHYEFHVWAHT